MWGRLIWLKRFSSSQINKIKQILLKHLDRGRLDTVLFPHVFTVFVGLLSIVPLLNLSPSDPPNFYPYTSIRFYRNRGYGDL